MTRRDWPLIVCTLVGFAFAALYAAIWFSFELAWWIDMIALIYAVAAGFATVALLMRAIRLTLTWWDGLEE